MSWSKLKLKDVCLDFIVPQRDKPTAFDGDIPWCRIEDIEGKYLHGSKSGQNVSKELADKMNMHLCPKGTVICACSASIGNQAITTVDCYTNQTFIGLVPNPQLLYNEYLYYFLRSQKRTLEELGTGATIKYISQKKFKELDIALPSIDEQYRIVNVLNIEFAKIDALKENAEKNLQNAIDLFQAVLRKELEPKEGWEISTIGAECKTGSGGTPNKMFKEYYEGGNVPWLRSGEVCRKYITETEMNITQLGVDNSSAKLFPTNTVVVAMYGATAGQVGILHIPTTTNQAICGILPNSKYIPEFIYYVIASQKKELVAQATGNAQPNISQVKVKGVKIPVIDIETQELIISRLDKLNEHSQTLRENYEKTITLCNDLKQALLRKAFNGEL